MPPSSRRRLSRIPGIVDLEVTLEQDIPEYRLTVDRERAVDTGLMTAKIVRTVGALVGGKAVSTYEDEDGDAVNLRVRLPRTCGRIRPGETVASDRSEAGPASGPGSPGGTGLL